jgi:hypothetical protein
METPRVTEIPLTLAAVEPDLFADGLSRGSAQRRAGERDARERQLQLVRRAIRARSVTARRFRRSG